MGRAYAIREYAMGRANAICDMRIRYGLPECDKRYANRLRAMSNCKVANTLPAARMRYAICEYAMRLRAISNCKVAFSATIWNRIWPHETNYKYRESLTVDIREQG